MTTIPGTRTILDPAVASIPLLVYAEPDVTLEEVVSAHRERIEQALMSHDALLFRGFGIDSAARFRPIADALCGRLVDYVYRSTPRTAIDRHVYTATEYPANAVIPMHHENAYQRTWPMKLAFCCVEPAESGGETPLARAADVTRRIDADIRRTFAELGVMYVRNYGQGVDLSWQTTFQSDSIADVEGYCRQQGIEWTWLGPDHLRTWQVCHALARHPRTGEEVWFNQAHVFHPSSLGPERHRALLDVFDEADLPRNACFGDGSAIDDATLAHIRHAYGSASHSFAWQRGDVLLLDNMRVAHGRNPYTGTRKVLVGMGEPCGIEETAPAAAARWPA